VIIRNAPADSPHALASRAGPDQPGSLGAPKNPPEEAPRQVASGGLQNEVPRMPDEAPPVLKIRCCRLVSDQLWMATGRTSRRRRFPRLYGMTLQSSLTSLAWKRWQDRRAL